MTTQELIGRDPQLEDVATWLGDPSRLPASRVVEGDPGIGKTSLVRAAMGEAERLGYLVLAASPVEPEARLAYAALGDLLAGTLDEVLPVLPAPQRSALEAALLLRPATGHRPEDLAVATAFLNALRALAGARPVLVALDDAQWLDTATTDVIRYAFRRLRVERVAILLARRTSADPRMGLDAAGLPSASPLALGPLSIGAIHALIVERTAAVATRPVLRHLYELSGGNPFYALELARGLADGRLRLEPGETLPRDLRALVGARIAGLPGETRTALAACAAMSSPTQPLLEAFLGAPDATSVLEPAFEGGVLDEADGGLVFTHPLLASAAYAGVHLGERRRMHARLAEVVPETVERARHLALATTDQDERVAAVVEGAATETFARGASADAAELAALARRLTPSDESQALARRRYLESWYRFESGDGEASAVILEDLIARAEPGPWRGRLLASLARVRHFQLDVASGVAIQRQALGDAGPDDELRGFLEESLAEGLLLMRADVDEARGYARSAASIADRRGDEASLAEALSALALTEQAAGSPRSDAIERALEHEPATLDLCIMRQPSFAWGSLLASEDQLDRARDVFTDLMRRADEHGNVTSISPIRNRLSTTLCLLGDLDAAEWLARESAEFAHQNDQLPSRASALGRLALVLARRGDVEGARDAAGRSLALAGGPDFSPSEPRLALARGGEHALWAMGELALSLGDAPEADRYLGPLSELLLAAGIREPGEVRFLGTQVEILVLLARLDDAARLAGWLETEAARVGRDSVHAAACAARGLVLAGQGDLDAAMTMLERARDAAHQAPLPFERARVLLLLGRVQRRATHKRAARATLELALEEFVRIGARRWASNVQDELGRIGGRAPARGTLSDTERQVVALVTQGLSNKEVASALFVTPKAIEANLSRVFAKTGVRSRAELAAFAASEVARVK
ncbi:MAG: AAA family ATPase [Candidatus Limnocylindrales bacterium]